MFLQNQTTESQKLLLAQKLHQRAKSDVKLIPFEKARYLVPNSVEIENLRDQGKLEILSKLNM